MWCYIPLDLETTKQVNIGIAPHKKNTSPPQGWHLLMHGWQAGGAHPTGMLSYFNTMNLFLNLTYNETKFVKFMCPSFYCRPSSFFRVSFEKNYMWIFYKGHGQQHEMLQFSCVQWHDFKVLLRKLQFLSSVYISSSTRCQDHQRTIGKGLMWWRYAKIFFSEK